MLTKTSNNEKPTLDATLDPEARDTPACFRSPWTIERSFLKKVDVDDDDLGATSVVIGPFESRWRTLVHEYPGASFFPRHTNQSHLSTLKSSRPSSFVGSWAESLRFRSWCIIHSCQQRPLVVSPRAPRHMCAFWPLSLIAG